MNPEPSTNSHDSGNVNENQNSWNDCSHEKLDQPRRPKPNRQLACHPCNEDGNSRKEKTKD